VILLNVRVWKPLCKSPKQSTALFLKIHTTGDSGSVLKRNLFTYDWEDWFDPSGKYIYMSPSCEWITGYHRDELLDMDMILKITHPDDHELVKKHFHEILRGSIEIHHIDFRIITRSGDERSGKMYIY
jgi:PAS domain-containing protein